MAHVVVAPPPTPVEPVTEVLHGIEVTDPYRWLEDQNSPRTRKWLDDQAAYTRAYFDALPDRERIRERVRELLALKEVISEPWNVGDRYFFLKRQEEGEQPVIARRDGLFGPETVLVDPALRATGAATTVAIAAVSQGGRFLAYNVRQGGTDYSTLEILDVERKVVLPDRLPEGFCTSIAFAPDGSGFYYSSHELHAARPYYRAVFWHSFDTARSADEEVFFAGESRDLYLEILPSQDGSILAYRISRAGKQAETSLCLKGVQREAVAKPLFHDVCGWLVPFFVGTQLLACTDISAPNRRIVAIDPNNPDPSYWRNVVAESCQRIRQFIVVDELIIVTRIERFSTSVQVFGVDGSQKDNIPFPPHGTADLPNMASGKDDCFISYTSLCKPSAVYRYQGRNREAIPWDSVTADFHSPVAIEEVHYRSKDDTVIPLLLARRKDLVCSGPLPTFLTGYGGFGSCVTPGFTAFSTFLIEQGFLFATPALRGGSELGEQWHQDGKGPRRQNSFTDLISAAEWLICQSLSIPGCIAIGGGSNAGLLVGAAITQRPDLFRAAVCLGPLLDMTRYHLFDFAAAWAGEYGSPDDENDFRYLLDYSPYQHVGDNLDYPAVLLVSGDADTRCNPMHARKMTARLQAATKTKGPVLLDYKPDWGHTAAQPLSIKIDALTNRLAFICYELGIKVQAARLL